VADFQSQFKSSNHGSGLEEIAQSRDLWSQKSNFIEQFNKVRCQLAIWSYNGQHSFLIPCGSQSALKSLSLFAPPYYSSQITNTCIIILFLIGANFFAYAYLLAD